MRVNTRNVLIAILGAFFVVLLGKYALSVDKYVPRAFMDARARGAKVANNIVNLSNEILKGLDTIEQYEQKGLRSKALNMISNVLSKNREMQKEAVKLSEELKNMASLINEIKPSVAREHAIEAVSSEVALVSRLINYNNFLDQLFKLLYAKLSNGSRAKGRVRYLIDQINQEARAINDLNEQFNNAITSFDNVYTK